MRHLSRLYPKRWRRRYGAEFEALIEELPTTPSNLLDVASGAFHAHLAESWHYAKTLLVLVCLVLIVQMAQLLVVMGVSLALTTHGGFPTFDLRFGSLDFYYAWQHDQSFAVGLGPGSAMVSGLAGLIGIACRARFAR
jgi:hypothetical protein